MNGRMSWGIALALGAVAIGGRGQSAVAADGSEATDAPDVSGGPEGPDGPDGTVAQTDGDDGLWPELGLQVHYSQWEGPYSSYGTGGRFRWEPLAWLGVEGTLEAVMTEATAGSRVDVSIGSQVYVPWELTSGFRTRAIAGLCALLSTSRGATPTSSDSDDIQVGVKAGAGLELALGGGWSAFTDLLWQRYVGHSREVSVWSNALDGDLVAVDRLTFALGLGVGL